ncbi:P-loop containing nucleoside triphosphate hydrolase protein [Aspergillus carlsbadensis]|nr:P-loop containing nucleoside triphosphate hydrolase protein [Aspergillus carlsbadensis]
MERAGAYTRMLGLQRMGSAGQMPSSGCATRHHLRRYRGLEHQGGNDRHPQRSPFQRHQRLPREPTSSQERGRVSQSCGQILALAPDLSKASKAASRVVDLVSTHSQEQEFGGEGDSAVMTSGGEERPLLKGLNITFEPGRFYALVGPSDSGKSIIFAMLERFYYPACGAVILNHLDVTRVQSTSFRDDIALLSQENIVFEGSSEIKAAAKLAHIHEAIMDLLQGYETVCTHDRTHFSGGQRQRLAVSRALIRQPRLLLLGESTSALDGDSERKIQDGLLAGSVGGLRLLRLRIG